MKTVINTIKVICTEEKIKVDMTQLTVTQVYVAIKCDTFTPLFERKAVFRYANSIVL